MSNRVNPQIDLERVIFDLSWYNIMSKQKFDNVEEAIAHYKSSENRTRSSCSPYIDEYYYLETNKDVESANITALEHYVLYGESEGRNPNALFDTNFYKNTTGATDNAIVDFLKRGNLQIVQTSPVFMAQWYADIHKITSNPLLHYILNGNDASFSPNPAFDATLVKKSLKIPDPVNIYSAYASHPARKTANFNEMFDIQYYKSCYVAEKHEFSSAESNLFEEFVKSPIEVDPNPIFSRKYYRDKYNIPLGTNEFCDFLSEKLQYRDPHPLFSSKYYYGQRPDVVAAGQNALKHFYMAGFAEHTDPHPLFSCDEYFDVNSDVKSAGMNPLVHYVMFGKLENRRLRKIAPIVDYSRRINRYTNYTPDNGGSAFSGTIGVFAHIYYVDATDEIIDYTNNIEHNATIYISTTNYEKAYKINARFSEKSNHRFVIKVMENRGRDIAPMLIGYKMELSKVDLALHIHTKKSRHYNGGFDEWRKYLLVQNCGSSQRVNDLINVFSNPEAGAVAPLDFPAVEKLINWGGNLESINKLISLMSNGEFSISRENKLEMPSGSMFWFRPSALDPLLKLDLPLEIFDPEEGQVDGTLAHALERAFFYIIELSGHRWFRFKATSHDLERPAFLSGKILPTNSGTRPTVVDNPEIRYFTAVNSENTRARINLLIPTAERSLGYAGISEALRIFQGIGNYLGNSCDIRIISTDLPFSENISVDHDAIICEMEDENQDNHYSIVDGSLKKFRLLSVRKSDIFVATAWWTALQAKNLLDQQSQMYGREYNNFVYLIQDYECGFYPWSSRYAFAESTYHDLQKLIPIFNTKILSEFFLENGYCHDGIIYNPPINEKISASLSVNIKRDRIVLIYMRRAALRNCLDFADGVIYEAIKRDPEFWSNWKFIAIGEEFDTKMYTRSGVIEGGQRLSLDAYAKLISTASIGLSFMVSPHPSYPPLEMAAAGMKVITNTYMNKDLSKLHSNIQSFSKFDEGLVAQQLRQCAGDIISNGLKTGVSASKCDWFFDGKTNLQEVFQRSGERVKDLINNVLADHKTI
jgi:hypothetical protein